ncbi:MAG: hypothetical protein MUF81_21135, partial [Verrucomicrobia bacterium]|nr:hypothetical protein [Verrucomicrobiota bacterium]
MPAYQIALPNQMTAVTLRIEVRFDLPIILKSISLGFAQFHLNSYPINEIATSPERKDSRNDHQEQYSPRKVVNEFCACSPCVGQQTGRHA